MKKIEKGARQILGILLCVVLLCGCGTTTSDVAEETVPAGNAAEGAVADVGIAELDDYEMKVHFLDVDQGLSILVQSGDDTLIYDGGDRDTSSFVVSYLKEQGVEKIDYLISSHYDSDHVYGLIGCLNAFDVENVISSDYEHDSQTYTKFVSAVESEGLDMQHPEVGTEFEFGTGSFTILAPEYIDDNDSNANSVVIKLENGENSFIFTGDADNQSEKSMISSGEDLECDVLSIAHHGSASATSWDFLEETVPEYAVISCGEGNQYGHPDEDIMEKLESMEIELYRSDKQGTVVVVSDGTELTWDQAPCNDYTPGDEKSSNSEKTTSSPGKSSSSSGESKKENNITQEPAKEEQVWISETGSKYHSKNNCGKMNPNKATQITRSEAEARGLDACSKCY